MRHGVAIHSQWGGGRSQIRGVEFQYIIVGQIEAKTHHISCQSSWFFFWQLDICHRRAEHGGAGFVIHVQGAWRKNACQGCRVQIN